MSVSTAGLGAAVVLWLCNVVARVVATMPFRWLRALGLPLAWLVGTVLRIRRAHVEAALARVVHGDAASSARAMYRALAATVMEVLWLSRRTTEDLGGVCVLDEGSRSALARARSLGRGVVLAASHTGNWELAACALAREAELTVVTKPIHSRGLHAFMWRARSSHGVGLALPEGALEGARAVLLRGGSVAMLIDQVPERAEHGIPVAFLGQTALVDRAPAALAAATGAPLAVVVARRVVGGSHEVRVLDVLQPPARGRRAWTLRATREATALLDGFVRRHPDQWLWMHRRWRGPLGDRRAAAACLVPRASLDERDA